MLELKKKKILELFANCQSAEDIYKQIIAIGQEAKKNSFEHQKPEYLVPGCQSLLYLYSHIEEGKMFFQAHSDALISMGLAQLLVHYFNGESAETVLKSPPTFLEELNIPGSLTPSRANGLYHIHLRMKQAALKELAATI